jgi:hypothetical protein
MMKQGRYRYIGENSKCLDNQKGILRYRIFVKIIKFNAMKRYWIKYL